MSLSRTCDILAMSAESPAQALLRAAEMRDWLLLAPVSRGQALHRVRALRPRAVLVQLTNEDGLTCSLALVRALHNRCPRLMLFAWSPLPCARAEYAARQAGVHAYGAADAGLNDFHAFTLRVPSRPLPVRAHGPPIRDPT